jgi:hypothetical protein
MFSVLVYSNRTLQSVRYTTYQDVYNVFSGLKVVVFWEWGMFSCLDFSSNLRILDSEV